MTSFIPLTREDQLEAIQDLLRITGMQVPLPTQFLHSLAATPKSNDSGRIHIIKRASLNDFFHLEDGEKQYLAMLPLWLWHIKIQPDLMLRIPVWRGEQPFKEEPENDDAVLKIVRRCFAENGLDVQYMSQWATKFLYGVTK